MRWFEPGWHAESLFTLFDPVWVLVLRHEAGHAASWHLGSDGSLATTVQHRSEPERLLFRQRLEPVALWLRMAPGTGIRLGALDTVRAFAALPAGRPGIMAGTATSSWTVLRRSRHLSGWCDGIRRFRDGQAVRTRPRVLLRGVACLKETGPGWSTTPLAGRCRC